ncbi:class I SAM-dependent methyltransferase [Kribbella sp. CA-247076]|uniref:class I SAM-dependent methyltransferase n=1 Tax=Kribbella sp. CA-247076 TaxID=3239941 RepID=UPI003D92598C
MTDERLARVAQGWDEAADGYEEYFVPRFAPWVRTAVDSLTSGSRTAQLSDGPILVPCCGTFPELELLVERFPARAIAGIDLSAGMVRRARERAARLGSADVEVVQGDAGTLDPRWSGACAAVVSVFGLQQLPDPEAALRSWVDALAPGGRMCVVYWPGKTEDDGPFALLAKVIGDRSDSSWEDRLVGALDAGTVERDEFVDFPMTHPDAATYFDAADRAGPMRALALARGDAYIAELRQRYVAAAPAGEWTHHPRARLILVRKPPSRAEATPPTS